MFSRRFNIMAVPLRYLFMPIVPLAVLMMVPLIVWQMDVQGQQTQQQLRATQLDKLRWQRYLTLLSNAPMGRLVNSSTRVSLEVALREAAQRLQTLPEIELGAFVVSAGDAIEINDQTEDSLVPIRISFEATLLHAPALLTVLAELSQVADWRVTEVRGCAMQRLASQPRLAAACAIDIYHWPWASDNNIDRKPT